MKNKERKWLRIARQNKGLTQKQLAQMIDISEEYYSLIEAGERQRKMDFTLVCRLSTALGISVPEIINQEELETYYIVDDDIVCDFEEALAVFDCILQSGSDADTKEDACRATMKIFRDICDKIEGSELTPKYKKQWEEIPA